VEGVREPDLDEQGDVVHHDGPLVRRARESVALGGQAPHLGVHDRVEPRSGLLVAEDARREGSAVQAAVGVENLLAEGLDDAVEAHGPGGHGLTSEEVVVDDDGAQLGEAPQDDRLAGGDTAREPDALHGLHPARARSRPPGQEPCGAQSGSLGSIGAWWSQPPTPRRQ